MGCVQEEGWAVRTRRRRPCAGGGVRCVQVGAGCAQAEVWGVGGHRHGPGAARGVGCVQAEVWGVCRRKRGVCAAESWGVCTRRRGICAGKGVNRVQAEALGMCSISVGGGGGCPARCFSIYYPDFSPRFTLSCRTPPS